MINLFSLTATTDQHSIVELLDHTKHPIAALYMAALQTRDLSKVVITETADNLEERYYLYMDGIGIYFTYYRVLKDIK